MMFEMPPLQEFEREEDLPPLSDKGCFYIIRPLELDDADKEIRKATPFDLPIRGVEVEPEL